MEPAACKTALRRKIFMSMPVFVAVQPIVLASGSPRRQEFLRGLGLEFTAVVTETPEPLPESGETPQAFAISFMETISAAPRFLPRRNLIVFAISK